MDLSWTVIFLKNLSTSLALFIQVCITIVYVILGKCKTYYLDAFTFLKCQIPHNNWEYIHISVKPQPWGKIEIP